MTKYSSNPNQGGVKGVTLRIAFFAFLTHGLKSPLKGCVKRSWEENWKRG